jgi:sialate O-acetylesterase
MTERDIWLPSIFSDNMMLQADTPTLIWGNTEPRQRVEVQIAGRRVSTRSDSRGDFKVRLPALRAGGPFAMTIKGGSERTVENVLVGDIWLGSGQSNMDWPVARSRNAEEEIAAARFPGIRLFTVTQNTSAAPCSNLEGAWVECSPQTVADFSATAYFFGREVHRKLGRPIGLINSSWGGTRIEPWISTASLKKYSGFSALIRPCREYFKPGIKPQRYCFHRDRGNLGVALGWAAPDAPASGWKRMKLPGYWTNNGVNSVGAVWFRKAVNIPRSWNGEDLYVSLGAIVDFDTTCFNGVKVGSIGSETRGCWDAPRKYLVPAALVRPGRNVIAVRAFAHNFNGGFSGPAESMNLCVINKKNKGTVSLAGDWHYRIERALPRTEPLSHGGVPGSLFNAMIHPLVNFPLKGFLWYQGESNIDKPLAYREFLPLLIRDWRQWWKRSDLPFYFAQLPDYRNPFGNNLPLLREAQLMALKLPNTGMAVIVDGNENDVHPRNKQLAGKRLALQALSGTYGKHIDYSGPVFSRSRVEAGTVRLWFEHSAKGLTTSDGKAPGDFLISGADKNFVKANARIEKDTVVVWSETVARPKAVRYAWAPAPQCNLCNKAGLPASPFRTDDWQIADRS